MNEKEALTLKQAAGMEPCWIVWEAATDGGRPYLVAVDTSEEQANLHVRAKRDEARVKDRPPPMLKVEESWLDHRYGESMTRDFDEAKKMVKELLRAQIAQLKPALREAIAMARAMRDALTPHQRARLERMRDEARQADDARSTTRTAEDFVLLDDLVRKFEAPDNEARARLDALEKLL